MKSKFPDNVTNHRFALQIEIQSYSVYNPLERLYTYVRTLCLRVHFCVRTRVKLHLQHSFSGEKDLKIPARDQRLWTEFTRLCVLSLNYRLPEGTDRWNHGIGWVSEARNGWEPQSAISDTGSFEYCMKGCHLNQVEGLVAPRCLGS